VRGLGRRRSWWVLLVGGLLGCELSWTYKTQTVGGLEGESGTGVPLLESRRTWVGIAEDMAEAGCGLSKVATR
jgi:hypothetical protein